MSTTKRIVVLSYNDLFFPEALRKHLKETYCFDVVVLQPFSSKVREEINQSDPEWQKIATEKFDKLIVFVGKQNSGSLEIIDLVCATFEKEEEKLFFVLCPHQKDKKERSLETFGVKKTQWMVFEDAHTHTQCQERPLMLGYLFHFLFPKEG